MNQGLNHLNRATAAALPRPRPGDRRRSIPKLASRIGLGLLSLAVLWVMVGTTAAAVLARRSPAAAVTLWPWSAAALSERAAEYAAQPELGADRFDQGRALAGRALDASLLSPMAARALGQAAAAARDHAAAERWFALSDTVSRRDLPTRMWLVQDALLHEDLAGAFRHIDIALRTSNSGARVLVPLLVNIAGYPQVARPLGERLALRPVWWSEFATALIAEQPANRSLAPLIAALRLDVADERERLFASQALSRLVLSQRFADAEALYRTLAPGAPAGVLRNGDFERPFALPPFDWGVQDESRIQRNRRPGGGDNMALYLLPGEPGNYVQQIQMLAPGRYRLSFTAGVDGNRPSTPPAVAVLCAAAQNRQIASAALPQAAGSEGAAGALDFTVPAADCSGQWIVVMQPQAGNPSGSAAWIDDIRLAPAAG